MLPAHKAPWPYGPPRSGHTSSCAGLSSAFQLLPLTVPQPASGSHVDQGLLALSSSGVRASAQWVPCFIPRPPWEVGGGE